MRPLLLDLFCGAGGAAAGYDRAGFQVVGVDLKPQPHYPFEFHQADAQTYPLEGFAAIHASPPCQAFSAMRKGRWKDREHPDLIAAMRERLIRAGVPYVIENVPGAPLKANLLLCGTMFGLQTTEGSQLRRHRIFEAPWFSGLTPPCAHNRFAAMPVYGGGQHPQRCYNESTRGVRVPPGAEYRRPATIGIWGNAGGKSRRDGYDHYGIDKRREAMGIPWMTGKELSEAIPPAYTEFIGKHLLHVLRDSSKVH